MPRTITTKICLECHQHFEVDSSSKHFRKFCSLDCAYKNPQRNKTGGLKRRKIYGERFCLLCGATFQLTSLHPNQLYCSVACASKETGKRTIKIAKAAQLEQRATNHSKLIEKVTCETCGVEFESFKRLAAKSCSNKCRLVNPNTPLRIATTRAKLNLNTSETTYSRAKRGWRDTKQGRVFFRSRMEANYAAYLDFLGIEWQYEPKTFWFEGIKRGTLSYKPDFYLPKENKYIETKGWMDSKSKTKLKRMAKYYPNIVVQVVSWKDYKEIENKLGKAIPNWEYKT